jgi:hypothetical protein
MPRVKYTYDGSTGTETTADFSAGEETAQDAIDISNESDYKAKYVPVSSSADHNRRFIMEVI